jgi:ABC-type uncharacterized transport system auxiliary subunit
MNRRSLLLLPLLAGCGLSERPYAERRQWPLAVARPAALPPRANGRILELRTLRAGPTLESRGLQTLQPDGSMKTGFYEEWAVPPAQGAEECLRRWLADSGLFAGITAPGSRATPDLSLEGELVALSANPIAKTATATLAITVITTKSDQNRILLQRSFTETAALQGDGPPAEVQATLAALTIVLARIEAALRGV